MSSTPDDGAVAPSFQDGKKMKRLRRLAGIRQATLARKVGISPAHLCNIENDKVINPGEDILGAIARELGCTIADFERDPLPEPAS